MKKIIFSTIVLFSLIINPLLAQDYNSHIYFFSELSPSFPTNKTRYLKNPNVNQGLEWRNKIGLRTFGNIFVGINGTIRTYQQQEKASYRSESGANNAYSYKINNTLWGLGPFITNLFEINEKIYLTTSVISNLEQGKGRVLITSLNNSEDSQPSVSVDKSMREITLSFNGEVGMGYLINPKLAIHLGLNLIRYERYSTSTGRTAISIPIEPKAERNVNVSGKEFSTFIERPIFNIGIIGALTR